MAETDNNIVYSSRVAVFDKSMLATMCLFYDTVYLPFVEPTAIFHGCIPSDSPVYTWDEEHASLFSEGILVRLEDSSGYLDPDALQQYVRLATLVMENHSKPMNLRRLEVVNLMNEIDRRVMSRLCIAISAFDKGTQDKAGLLEHISLVYHVFRDDLDYPEIIDTIPQSNWRELAIVMQAHSALSYLVPRVGALEPDQILEIRNQISDTREGFAFHLQKLSKGIDSRIKGGETPEEIRRWTKDLVDTDLIPDYREFTRQLQAGHSLSGRAGRAFEISASPWTAKFWGDIARAFGLPIHTAAEQFDRRTNRFQAFQFMRTVEESRVAEYQRGHRGA